MSKLTEYIKLLPRAIGNIDKVVEGMINQVKLENGTLPQEDVEAIALRRLICSQCPYMSINATKLGIYKTDRDDPHCMHCGCPIERLTASLTSDCGLEHYNKEHPNDQRPLKWVKTK